MTGFSKLFFEGASNLAQHVTNRSTQPMEHIRSAVRRSSYNGTRHGFIIKHRNKYSLPGRAWENNCVPVVEPWLWWSTKMWIDHEKLRNVRTFPCRILKTNTKFCTNRIRASFAVCLTFLMKIDSLWWDRRDNLLLILVISFRNVRIKVLLFQNKWKKTKRFYACVSTAQQRYS